MSTCSCLGRWRWSRRRRRLIEADGGRLGGKRDQKGSEREDNIRGRQHVSIEEALGVDTEAKSNEGDVVAPSDKVADEVLDTDGGLIGRRASTTERDLEGLVDGQVAIADGRVLGHESLAGGKALEGVVGDGEVGLAGGLQGVGGVVLEEEEGDAGAVDGDEDEGVGGDRANVGGEVVGGGDEGGVGAEEVGYGHWGVVGRDGSEGQVRGAC